ncbi:MAG: hypothetical protein K5762_01945 [Bacilli bacterium]|jgi:hypothetical protein|nr:hypothetical protein [Bacilli bacterium]
MENLKLNVNQALKYLKASYHLYSIINKKEEDFFYLDDSILVKSELKSFKIKEYDFLSLYKECTFYLLEDNNEETVDVKKDEEYYSWRQ